MQSLLFSAKEAELAYGKGNKMPTTKDPYRCPAYDKVAHQSCKFVFSACICTPTGHSQDIPYYNSDDFPYDSTSP